MTNLAGAVLGPGADPVDPVVVLAALVDGLRATEATIVRLQAVREAQLAVAQRLAEDLATDAAPAKRGESVELAARSVAAELAGVLHMSDRVVQARMGQAADLMTRFPPDDAGVHRRADQRRARPADPGHGCATG